MKLIQATVSKAAKQIPTKYGDRVVLNCLTYTGEEIAVWGNPGDSTLTNRYPNEPVNLAVNEKGKYSVVEQVTRNATLPSPKSDSKAEEIKDYSQRLTKLYSHCFRTVSSELSNTDLPLESLKDIATCVFITTQRKFNL
ncbi:hypothetical protein [Myxosarcina sp. GI1]|uniref:hypothetical protein n=1 Tax=Myxosarcina sp. GI1 TaxID=1541065 RepID=UPI0005603588|nr:hypothetical protein [Myxosarcina sp. GI1]